MSDPRLHYPPPLDGLPVHQSFYFRHPVKQGALFRDVQYSFFKEAEEVELEKADAIVLVNNFIQQPEGVVKEYIKKYADLAEDHHIPLYLFSCGDWTDGLTFDARAHVFKYSLYASSKNTSDIMIPSPTEEPPEDLLFVRDKGEKPVVSFCGKGSFATYRSWVKYFAQNLLLDIQEVYSPIQRAKKNGVYWRRVMMRSCSASSQVVTNFIVRRTFSGHKKSIELDPKQARKEYLESIANSDFVLAPKGDGNYSLRFCKTLAFGRIPVVVDTDTVLPLEDFIPYEKVVVRVPMKDAHKTASYITHFYETLTNEEWKKRQELAREVFTKFLNQDSFFRYFFTHMLTATVDDL